MKKSFILLLILSFCCIEFVSATSFKQSKYRWRNNNGNEAGATWKAAENTPITLTDFNETLRFRGEYYCTGAASSVGHYLSYSKNGGTTWTEINESAANDFMLLTTTEVAHGTNTTNQLGTATSGTFASGKIISQNTPSMGMILAAGTRTEIEWVIKPTASVQNNTTYLFENRTINTIGVQGQLTTNFPCIVPVVTVVDSFRRCGPGTFQLTASATPSNSNITWWTAVTGGTNIGTGATITSPAYAANTTVYVQAANGSCASARTAVALIVEDFPIAIDLTDGNYCINDTTLELTTIPAYPNTYTYLWHTNDTTPSIDAGLSYGSPVTYWVQVTSPNGCVQSDTTLITLNPIPKVDLGNDTTICANTFLTLDAGNTGSTYQWSTSELSQSINVSPADTFSVTVTNIYNCSANDTIIVNVFVADPITIDIADGSHCIDDTTLELTTIPAYPNTYMYLWNTNATNSFIDAGLSYGNQVEYWVQVTGPNGCIERDTVQISLNPVPKVNLGNDTVICTNALLTLDAENTGSTYLWNTGAQTQTIAVSPVDTYSVTVTNAYNCAASDTIFLDAIAPAKVNGFTFIPRFEIEAGRVDFAPLNPVSVDTYHWNFGNGQTSNVMNASHTYSNSGTYNVILTVANDCGSTMDTSLTINVDRFTGMVTVDDPVQLNLYPIPAQNALNIQSPTANVLIHSVSIVNMSGQELLRTINLSKQHFVQDISMLADGHYFVRIKTNKGDGVKKISIAK